MTMIV